MNKINLFLLLSFLLAATLTGWYYYQVSHRVGDISFDEKTDDADFELCDEAVVVQDYSAAGADYRGGKKAIKKQLLEDLQENDLFEGSGWITFRFVVNCKGETGRFRVHSINQELQEINFDQEQVHHLITSVEKLKDWKPGTWKESNYDSYYQINFKIENGTITDIF